MDAAAEAAALVNNEDSRDLSRFRTAVEVHIECGRPDVGCYIGLVGVSGVLLASDQWSIWDLIAAFLIPALVSTGAYYGGAYVDRDIDAVTKPGRPVPAGVMSARAALISMVAYVIAGLVLATVFKPENLLLVLAAALTGAAYRAFRKARRPIRVFLRGVATMAAFGIAVVLTSASPKWDLIFLALIFWQQDSMIHQVLAIEDTEVDRRAGIVTLPTRYGHKAALLVLVVTLLFWFSSAAFQPPSVKSRPVDMTSYAPFLVIATVLAVLAMVTLFRATRPLPGRPVARAYGLLALERPCIAAGLIAASGAVVLGWVVLVLSSSLTLLTRHALTAAQSRSLLVAAERAR